MKNLHYALVFLCLIPTLSAQHLTNYQLLHSYNQNDINTYLTGEGVPTIFVSITNNMDIYRIEYTTVSYDSTATVASGTVFVPTGLTCRIPIVSYGHGTTLAKVDAPSNETGEYVVGVALAADGFVVSMPDYLGLGNSPGLHPYHHAQSEATCTIDMIRATQELLDTLGVPYGEDLFITGYSQGGHVAMATHKFIQDHLSSEFTVRGSAPLSGAYDLAGVQAEVITRDSSYGAPGYLPFLIFSFNMVYNLYPSYSDIFISPYDTILPPLMDGSVGLGTIENLIPDTPNLILQPALLDSFQQNPNFIFRQKLRENSLYYWVPSAPVKMLYCEADHLVSYRNAIVTRDTMNFLGAPNVSAMSAATNQNHQGCALYAILQAKYFFESLRTDRYQLQISSVTSASDALASDGSALLVPNGGTAPYSYTWSSVGSGNNPTNLPAGTYTVTVTDANQCSASVTVQIGVMGMDDLFGESGIMVYPNPARDAVMLDFMQPLDADLSITLTDLSGRQVHRQIIPAGTVQYPLNLSHLAGGVYGMALQCGTLHLQKKLVIE